MTKDQEFTSSILIQYTRPRCRSGKFWPDLELQWILSFEWLQAYCHVFKYCQDLKSFTKCNILFWRGKKIASNSDKFTCGIFRTKFRPDLELQWILSFDRMQLNPHVFNYRQERKSFTKYNLLQRTKKSFLILINSFVRIFSRKFRLYLELQWILLFDRTTLSPCLQISPRSQIFHQL